MTDIDEVLTVPLDGKNETDEPEDKGNTMWLIFAMYGAAVLLPWNMLSSCFDFFNFFVGKEEGGLDVFSTFPFANNFLMIAGMMFVIVTGNKYSYNMRISGSLFVIGIFMLILPWTAHIGGAAGYWITTVLLLVYGFVCGIAQSSVFGLAGALPFRYMAAVMLGNGLVGIGSNSIRAVTYKVFPVYTNGDTVNPNKDNAFYSALVCFSISTAFVWVCAALMRILKKNPCA